MRDVWSVRCELRGGSCCCCFGALLLLRCYCCVYSCGINYFKKKVKVEPHWSPDRPIIFLRHFARCSYLVRVVFTTTSRRNSVVWTSHDVVARKVEIRIWLPLLYRQHESLINRQCVQQQQQQQQQQPQQNESIVYHSKIERYGNTPRRPWWNLAILFSASLISHPTSSVICILPPYTMGIFSSCCCCNDMVPHSNDRAVRALVGHSLLLAAGIYQVHTTAVVKYISPHSLPL